MDVDKADYLLRDNHYLENSILFPSNSEKNGRYEVRKKDIKDIFYNARVSDDKRHIEYKYSDFGKIYHLFDTRSQFHMSMYQNTECIFIEKLLAELVKLRDLNSTNKFSEVDSRNMEDFLKLTDQYVSSELDKVEDPDFRRKWKALQNRSYSEVIGGNLNSYRAHVDIEYAGTKMREDDIPFYGDITKKPQIKQMKGIFEKTSYYAINDSNNNDNN